MKITRKNGRPPRTRLILPLVARSAASASARQDRWRRSCVGVAKQARVRRSWSGCVLANADVWCWPRRAA